MRTPADRSRPTNLLLPLTGFVGRSVALDEVRRLLASVRLLTLTGPGGVGKTRLALQVAFAALDQFRDGIWWVDLASLCDANLVAHQVAAALGLPEDPACSREAAIGHHLASAELLLVFDNCEHLVAACAALSEQLLRSCPGLHILATSREALGVGGEIVWRVPPLSLPCVDGPVTEEALAESDAAQLFLQRARAIQPDLAMTPERAAAVARVCCRLDGLPLAIELAAARVGVLSLPQIAARLDDRFRLLTAGSRTADPHHQTLEAALAWSYDLLSPSEQRLFERLAVFSGGFTLRSAEAVAGDTAATLARQGLSVQDTSGTHGPSGRSTLPGDSVETVPVAARDVLDLLSQLVAKSLVEVLGAEPPRYQMLETIRQYALERLLASGDAERIRAQHLAYHVGLAEGAEARLMGEDQVQWLRLIEADHDNLRAALAWSQAGAAQEGLRLAAALAAFWLRTGQLSEGSGWLEQALASCREPDPIRIKAMVQAGRLAQQQGHYERALELGRESLALSHNLGDRQGIARSLGLIGWVLHWQGDREEASAILEEALAHARDSGDRRTIARILFYLGDLLVRKGEPDRASALLQESLEVYQQMGDAWSMAWALGALGEVARLTGDFGRATAHLQMSVAILQELNSRSDIPYPLEALALVAAVQGRHRRAAQLWGAASAMRDAVHALLPPSYQADYASHVARARATLGEAAFVTAWAEGRIMALEQALALATTEPAVEPAVPPPPSIQDRHGLTPRELEVLRLVASGLSDAQIADRLVISPRTVGKHLQTIYSKLYLPSRSAATRWAIEHHLA